MSKKTAFVLLACFAALALVLTACGAPLNFTPPAGDPTGAQPEASALPEAPEDQEAEQIVEPQPDADTPVPVSPSDAEGSLSTDEQPAQQLTGWWVYFGEGSTHTDPVVYCFTEDGAVYRTPEAYFDCLYGGAAEYDEWKIENGKPVFLDKSGYYGSDAVPCEIRMAAADDMEIIYPGGVSMRYVKSTSKQGSRFLQLSRYDYLAHGPKNGYIRFDRITDDVYAMLSVDDITIVNSDDYDMIDAYDMYDADFEGGFAIYNDDPIMEETSVFTDGTTTFFLKDSSGGERQVSWPEFRGYLESRGSEPIFAEFTQMEGTIYSIREVGSLAEAAGTAATGGDVNGDYTLMGGDNEHSFAIGFLGSYPYSEAVDALEEYTLAYFGSPDSLVDCGGEELYAIVPRLASDEVVIKTMRGPNANGKMTVDKTVYTGYGSVFLLCNPSDLFSNVEITVGGSEPFSPKISLQNGRVLLPKAAIDITGVVLAAGEGNDSEYTIVLATVLYKNSSTVLIDDLLWIDGSDTETLSQYDIPEELLSNDYAIVNIGDDDYHPYSVDEQGSFSMIEYDDASASGFTSEYYGRSEFMKKLKAYCAQYQGATLLANITFNADVIIGIDEVYTP